MESILKKCNTNIYDNYLMNKRTSKLLSTLRISWTVNNNTEQVLLFINIKHLPSIFDEYLYV